MTTETILYLHEPIEVESIHAITGQAYETGTLPVGARVRRLAEFPYTPAGPVWRFDASTDDGRTWYCHRAGRAPVVSALPPGPLPEYPGIERDPRDGPEQPDPRDPSPAPLDRPGCQADCRAPVRPLAECADLAERLAPGDPAPLGECRACGTFVYAQGPRARVLTLEAIERIYRRYMDEGRACNWRRALVTRAGRAWESAVAELRRDYGWCRADSGRPSFEYWNSGLGIDSLAVYAWAPHCADPDISMTRCHGCERALERAIRAARRVLTRAWREAKRAGKGAR